MYSNIPGHSAAPGRRPDLPYTPKKQLQSLWLKLSHGSHLPGSFNSCASQRQAALFSARAPRPFSWKSHLFYLLEIAICLFHVASDKLKTLRQGLHEGTQKIRE